jgi:hypothetical protein
MRYYQYQCRHGLDVLHAHDYRVWHGANAWLAMAPPHEQPVPLKPVAIGIVPLYYMNTMERLICSQPWKANFNSNRFAARVNPS